jgi:tRNA(Ile)-lysidine synthase
MKADIPFEIAHVNFQLRGQESMEDESFVRNWADHHDRVFHLLNVDTKSYASEHHISTQMAAREIRYSWFEDVRTERKLAGIILAHHRDDQMETIFLNLIRGTGIEGIYGMAEHRGRLIRPILSFSRAEISGYAKENSIQWREDSSNEKTDYKRNHLRHISLPALYDLSPDAKENLFNSFSRLRDTGKAFGGLYERWQLEKIKVEDDLQILSSTEIKSLPGAVTLLYFWIRSYGFNSHQAQDAYQTCLRNESGKIFESPTHLLNIDREAMILAPRPLTFSEIEINQDDIELKLPECTFDLLKLEGKDELDKSRQNAMLDLERLTFPLTIRTWQEGDKFTPLGMKNTKKISDFLIDLKVPLLKKSSVKVLLSEGKIAWVIGLRISDWAKSTAATRKLLYLKKRA